MQIVNMLVLIHGNHMWEDVPSEMQHMVAVFFFDSSWVHVGGWPNLRPWRLLCQQFASRSHKIYDNLLQHRSASRLGNPMFAVRCPDVYTRAVTMFVIREISKGVPINLGAYSLIYHRVYCGATCVERENNPRDYYNTLTGDSPAMIHQANLTSAQEVAVVRILSGVFKYVQLRYCARQKLTDVDRVILSELSKLKEHTY